MSTQTMYAIVPVGSLFGEAPDGGSLPSDGQVLYWDTTTTKAIGSSDFIYSDTLRRLILKAGSSQSANLQEWQNSSGSILARILPTGELDVGDGTNFLRLVGASSNLILSAASQPLSVGVTGAAVFNVYLNGSTRWLWDTDYSLKPSSDGGYDFGSLTARVRAAFTKSISHENVTKTTTYIATVYDHVIRCNASGGAFTVTLPSSLVSDGLILHVKKTDSSVNAVTIAGGVGGGGASSLDTGLQAYWALEETSGNRSAAFGGITLTSNNAVGYSAGQIGNAANFDSSLSQTLSSTSNLLQTGDYSVSAWIKPTLASLQSPTWGTAFASYTTGDVIGNWAVAVDSSGNVKWYDWESNGSDTDGRHNFAAGMSTGAWHHVVAVKSSGTWVVYVDGVSISAGARDATGAGWLTSNFRLGSMYLASGYYWKGNIDEVGIWTKALSSGEVALLYSGYAYPFPGGGAQDLIEDTETFNLVRQGESLMMSCNGTSWDVI